MKIAIPIVLLVSGVASAGVDKRTCQTADGSIVMTAQGQVQIKLGKQGKDGTVDHPVAVMPDYAITGGSAAKVLITAIPISAEKLSKKKYQQMHVVHADGTSCEGRESRTHVAKLSYVLMGPDGASLSSVIGDKQVSGLTADGYIVAQFTCDWEFVSSPGGCSVGDGDKVTYKPIK